MTFLGKWHRLPGEMPHKAGEYVLTISHKISSSHPETRRTIVAQYDRILEEFHFTLPQLETMIGLKTGRILIHMGRGVFDLHPRYKVVAWCALPPPLQD